MKKKRVKKIDWLTVSVPKKLVEDIIKLIDDTGYYPSLGSYVREALLEKLRRDMK